MDDRGIECGIMALLDARSELYPRQIAVTLGVADHVLGPALSRLHAQRQVARLLGRYLPAADVASARGRWLTRLDAAAPAGRDAIRARVAAWTGWTTEPRTRPARLSRFPSARAASAGPAR